MTISSPLVTKDTILDAYTPTGKGGESSSDIVLLTDGTTSTFEEIMKERNRVRKEREEYSMAELKVQIVRLEDALAAETRRRVDATTSLDDKAREQVYEMEGRLRTQLQEDNQKLEGRLATLESRLGELEGRWEKESHEQMDAIHQKAQDYARSLERLQQEQDTERKSRLKREGALLQQVENHANEFEDRWSVERKDRIERVARLEAQVHTQEAKRLEGQAKFQQRVEQELDALRQDLEDESQERATQDEEIVSALNRYTQQLQQSLSILSSD